MSNELLIRSYDVALRSQSPFNIFLGWGATSHQLDNNLRVLKNLLKIPL